MFVTDDIVLREARLEDASALWAAIDSNRGYLSVWLPFVTSLRGPQDEECFLASVLAVPEERRNTVYVVECAGELCGLVGFVNTDADNRRTEIGYWLLPPYQGRGVMTGCVRRLCLHAVRERGMNRIQIRCAAGNGPSNAIPLRLGFTREGMERDGELLSSGEFTDVNVYSILASEVSEWEEEGAA